jgi:hypothetical protein
LELAESKKKKKRKMLTQHVLEAITGFCFEEDGTHTQISWVSREWLDAAKVAWYRLPASVCRQLRHARWHCNRRTYRVYSVEDRAIMGAKRCCVVCAFEYGTSQEIENMWNRRTANNVISALLQSTKGTEDDKVEFIRLCCLGGGGGEASPSRKPFRNTETFQRCVDWKPMAISAYRNCQFELFVLCATYNANCVGTLQRYACDDDDVATWTYLHDNFPDAVYDATVSFVACVLRRSRQILEEMRRRDMLKDVDCTIRDNVLQRVRQHGDDDDDDDERWVDEVQQMLGDTTTSYINFAGLKRARSVDE